MTSSLINSPFILFQAQLNNLYDKKSPPKSDRFHLALKMSPNGATKSLCGLSSAIDTNRLDSWFFLGYSDLVKFDKLLSKMICKRCR